MQPQEVRERLGTLLGEAVYRSERLMVILRNEREALRTNDVDGINQAGEAKRQCVALLDGLDQERRDLCKKLGYGSGGADMELLCGKCDPEGFVFARWERLLGRLEMCRNGNDINGRIVKLRRQHALRALALLRGQSNELTLYGPSGDNQSDASASMLGSA